MPPKAGSSVAEFQERLLAGLLTDAYRYQPASNREWRTSGAHTTTRMRTRDYANRVRDLAFRAGDRLGVARRHFDPVEAAGELSDVITNLAGYERTYARLADDHSRGVLIDLLRFRVLGAVHVRLPVTVSEFEDARARVDGCFRRQGDTTRVSDPLFGVLNRYEWPGADQTLSFYSHSISVVSTFVLEQYSYTRGGVEVGAREGEIAIDAGGCWGDTALYLADRVGPQGKVLCFEFAPESMAVIRRNLESSKPMSDRVTLVPAALWDETGQALDYSQAGAFTSLAMDREGHEERTATTVTVDDFVEREGLPRVDFLKMDIEGAEMAALRGAEQVLRSHRPTLAIAAYHYEHDLIDIPAFLDGLDVGYRFYLDHFSAGRMETVLFAAASTRT